MIKLFEALTESIDIDSNICSDTEKLEHPEHYAIYRATVETINSNTQNVTKAAKEIIVNYRDFSNFKNMPETSARVSSLALNPSIELINKSELNDLVSKINNVEVNALTDRLENESIYNSNMKLSDYDVTECKLDTKLIFNKVIKAIQTITLLYENIEDCNSIIIGELSKCESTHMFDLLSRISSIVTFREAKKIEIICKAIYPLIMMANQHNHNLNEAVETATINNEDIMTYVNELSELVPKCRDYFDTFKYKELVTPRKKKINKMMEYMRGALERKYTLRIPLYKIVNASPEAKNIIENQFIKGLEKIVNKYPNYILMTPDFKDDDDMFIYITLKEPFGKEEHRSDRKAQSDAKILEESVCWKGMNKAVSLNTIFMKIYNQHKTNSFKLLSSIDDLSDMIAKSVSVTCNKDAISYGRFIDKSSTNCIAILQNTFDNNAKSNFNKISRCIEQWKTKRDEIIKNEDKQELISLDNSNKRAIGTILYNLVDLAECFGNIYADDPDSDFYLDDDIISEYSDILTQAENAMWSNIITFCKLIKIQYSGKVLAESSINWEDPEYNRINNAIDRQNRLIDNISARIDKSIVANGKEDSSLNNAYDKACDARDKLIKERHVIAKRMMNETALTTDDRNNLPDEIFGLPGRRYPLNDMNHIRLAIARMDPCTRDEKRDLANNICRQICQQKLVGKVNMSPSNPNCKYFPKWLCDQDASMDGGYIHSNGDKFSVKEILAEGLSGHTLEFYI